MNTSDFGALVYFDATTHAVLLLYIIINIKLYNNIIILTHDL